MQIVAGGAAPAWLGLLAVMLFRQAGGVQRLAQGCGKGGRAIDARKLPAVAKARLQFQNLWREDAGRQEKQT